MTKQELGLHLYELIRIDLEENKIKLYRLKKEKIYPLSFSTIYRIKRGEFDEATMRKIEKVLGIEIEFIYKIINK